MTTDEHTILFDSNCCTLHYVTLFDKAIDNRKLQLQYFEINQLQIHALQLHMSVINVILSIKKSY